MPLNRVAVNSELRDAYADWLSVIAPCLSDDVANKLTPPLFLSATQGYCDAQLRIMVFGQETRGWNWDASDKPGWAHAPMWTMCDIRDSPHEDQDPTHVMMDAYDLFAFGKGEGMHGTRTSSFFRGFREFSKIRTAALMWSNVCRMAYWRNIEADVDDGRSFLEFEPVGIRNKIIGEHGDLARRELEILKPDACVFLTGPNYDFVLDASFPDIKRERLLPGVESRSLAKLSSPVLPKSSFRTYHPSYLGRNREARWPLLRAIVTAVEAGVS